MLKVLEKGFEFLNDRLGDHVEIQCPIFPLGRTRAYLITRDRETLLRTHRLTNQAAFQCRQELDGK